MRPVTPVIRALWVPKIEVADLTNPEREPIEVPPWIVGNSGPHALVYVAHAVPAPLLDMMDRRNDVLPKWARSEAEAMSFDLREHFAKQLTGVLEAVVRAVIL